MACALTQGYSLDCRDAVGGVSEVWITEFSNVSDKSITNGLASIELTVSKVFRKYEVVVETADTQEDITTSRENGTSFVKQTVKFPINKQTVSVRDELLILGKQRLLIAVKDNNGNYLVYGYANGLMLEPSVAKTGVKYGDRNGYELVFGGNEFELAPYVDSGTIGTYFA